MATGLVACPHCLEDMAEQAKTCHSCGATRRKVGGKWTNRREGLRNDIMLSVLAVFVVMGLLWMLAALLPSRSVSSTSLRSSCPASNPAWPDC